MMVYDFVRLVVRHSRYNLCNKTLRSIFHTSCVLDDSEVVKKKPSELDNYPGKEFTTAWQVKQKGKIYDKWPFKFFCEKGKTYKWCACGLSKNQIRGFGPGTTICYVGKFNS